MARDRSAERRCVVIGAGPAGLTAAYELSKLRIPAVVFEKDAVVGGLARTSSYRGYRFDIGGHRFFTRSEAVHRFWCEILEDDFLVRERLSRIYYEGRFFHYPLRPANALLGLGPVEALRIVLSFLRMQCFPLKDEHTFEAWVTNRFGRRLYQIFFATYTEKVWGVPGSEISADWAAQRIKGLDLLEALKAALLGSRRQKAAALTTIIDRFHYPRLGPGMMWERCREMLSKRGVQTHTDAQIVRLRWRNAQVTGVTVRDASGREREEHGNDFISSMPLPELLHRLHPRPPASILTAASCLRYRDFLTVVLIIDNPNVFPDQWIYIHSPEVRLGRVQNFKNWSSDMVPDPSKSALGLEYFLHSSSRLWNASDEALIALGRSEAVRIGLIKDSEVIDGCVVRMPNAYPVYDTGYQEARELVLKYLDSFSNLETVGRNGQHRYNNQDDSMLAAMDAVRRLAQKRGLYSGGGSHAAGEATETQDLLSDRMVPVRAVPGLGS